MDHIRYISMLFSPSLAAQACEYSARPSFVCSAVCDEPWLISDPRTHLSLGKPDTPENRAAFVSTVPLGRPSTPAEVANTCCYLASEEEKAGFITEVNIEVDGGRCV